jgi:RHS repeat-associated protein
VRTATALLTLLLTLANLSLPFAQARNDRNLQTRLNLHPLKACSHRGVGNVVIYYDGFGPDIVNTYDALDHLISSADGEGDTTRFKFDGEGLLVEQIKPKGGPTGSSFKTSYEYNKQGSLTQVTDAAGKTWQYGYDNDQKLTSVTDPLTHTVSYVYDSLHRLKQLVQPGNVITAFDYDANNNQTLVADALGQKTQTVYDLLDRPQSVDYSLGPNILPVNGPRHRAFGYDPEGNLTSASEISATNGSVVQRSYARTYDARGRLQTASDPMGHMVQYGYDAADNVTSFTDAASRQTSYTYDGRNRLQTVMASGRSINYTWKPDGLLDQVTYGNGMSRVYGYDNADRLKSVINTFGSGNSEQFSYDYDSNSNRTAETRKLNAQTIRTVSYGFDDLDRLTRASYTSSNVGRGLKGEYYNNRDFTDLQFSRLDPTIDFSWPGTATPDPRIADDTFSIRWSGKVQAQYSESYTFYLKSDAAGRLYVNGQLVVDDFTDHTSNEASGTISLQAGQKYDIKLEYSENTGDAEVKLSWSSASQAKQIVPPSALFVADTDLNYEYDAVGNRTRENGTDLAGVSIDRSYGYDANNRLTAINGQVGDPLGPLSFVYDANGNLKSLSQGGSTNNYDYDVGNQLRRITRLTSEVASFDYDIERRRISKTSSGIPQMYVYDGDRVVNEYGSSGQLVNRYDYGVDLVRGELGGEGERFYFSDAQGSITGLAQGSGGLATRNEYDAWGEKILAGASYNRIGYTGQYRDEETGLMALGNGERYYASSFGRFIQEDSFAGMLGLPQSLNRHSYVHNNPLAFVDQFAFSPDEPRGDMYKASRKYGLENVNDNNWWSSFWKNFFSRSGYDAWNTISFGMLEQNDTLTSDYYAKRISEQQYYEGRAKIGFVAAAQLALMLAGARVGGALTEIQAIGKYAVARFAVGAGVNAATQFAGESLEIGLGMRHEYAPVSSYAFNALLGGLMNARAKPAAYREGANKPTVEAGRLQERVGVGESPVTSEGMSGGGRAVEEVATAGAGRRYGGGARDEVSLAQRRGVGVDDDIRVAEDPAVVDEAGPSNATKEGGYIGRERQLGPGSVDDIITSTYERYYAEAGEAAVQRFNAGRLKIPSGQNWRQALGQWIDARARVRLRRFLTREGIPEGPGQDVLVNRWLRDPSGSGLYRIPDVRLMGSQRILDGTIGAKTAQTPQVVDFTTFSGGFDVRLVRPQHPGLRPR